MLAPDGQVSTRWKVIGGLRGKTLSQARGMATRRSRRLFGHHHCRAIFKASQRPSDSLARTNEEHLNIQVLEYEKAARSAAFRFTLEGISLVFDTRRDEPPGVE